MLSHLKRVTQENRDLETETAILREAAEKLKYDLANYRLLSDDEETNLAQINDRVAQLDSKHLKTIEKLNSFQLQMSNMQQEINHLRTVYRQVISIHNHAF